MGWWQDNPIRLIQTNIREIDMADLTIERMICDLKEFRANTLLFNAGGIVANYRSGFDYHHINEYLGDVTVKELVNACHNEGIRVIGRGDFSRVRKRIWEQHPDWAYIGPDGSINRTGNDINVCFLSRYQQEYAFDIMKEMLEKLDIDGIFLNNTGFMSGFDYGKGWVGNCHCRNCQDMFRDWCNEKIPAEGDANSAAAKKYRLFQQEIMASYRKKLAALKETKQDICISMIDMEPYEAGTHLRAPQANHPYMALAGVKASVLSNPGKLVKTTSVDFVDLHYRHAAVSKWLQGLRIMESIANGGIADYFVIGRLDNQPDRSAHEVVKSVYCHFAEHEAQYHGTKSIAGALLLKHHATIEESISRPSPNRMSEYYGWLRILTEHHFDFDSAYTTALSDIDLTKYRTIIVPDLPLSEQSASQLDQYVKDGGILIVTGEGGLAENLSKQKLDCLGVKTIHNAERYMKSAYLEIDAKDGFTQFADRSVVMVSKLYLHGSVSEQAKRYGRFVPQHRFGPPESCYYTEVTEEPAVVINPYGAGKGVWIPWLPAGEFYDASYCFGMSDFLIDLLTNILGIQPICIGLHPMVEVSVREHPDGSLLLHLINTSGCFDKSYYEPVTMHDLKINLHVGRTASCITDIVRNDSLPYQLEGGCIRFEIPRLEQFCCVKIDK